MTSRLDRLFILLESGSSNVTRRAAAKQIGEVQKLYPHELHSLLNRLISYLHNNQWETRIAAAQAIEAVLSNVPVWNPAPNSMKIENSNTEIKSETLLTFDNFNLSQVLLKGARLMGSEGTEFDEKQEDSSDSNSCSSVERLQKQRALLNEKLGVTQASKLGISINEMITDDDMQNQSSYNVNDQKVPVQEILNLKMTTGNGQGMSCREINRARRKARQQLNSTPSSSNLKRSNSNGSSSLDEPEKKKFKTESEEKFQIFYTLQQPVPDATNSWNCDVITWPLEQFCSKLYLDLFNPKWETRHGAATALRELFNFHAIGSGKNTHMNEEEMEFNHNLWLEDATLRFLCVLSLDRFGDFISDQVVAPVRETCAQVLGTLMKDMSTEKVDKTVSVLLNLMKQNDWEVRHGGLLGLKYVLVVREDLLPKFLPIVINHVLNSLLDPVDDVGSVAASTLIPICSWLPKLLSSQQVSNILQMLWDLLLNQDELTSACNSFMGLLAGILSLPDAPQWIQHQSLAILIPRLWPFLAHCSSSVRKSTLKTLETLTSPHEGLNFGVKKWQAPLLQEALRHIYQRILIEPVEDIQSISVQVWQNLVSNADLSPLLHAACPYVSPWICLAMQPVRLAFDISQLLFAQGRRSDLGGLTAIQSKLYLGGPENIPQDIREKNHFRARVCSAKVLGALSQYLVKPAPGVIYTTDMESPMDCYIKVLLGHLHSRSAVQRFVCSLTISFWARFDPNVCPGPLILQEKLKACILECIYYDEVGILFTRLLQEAQDFLATLKQHNILLKEFENLKILNIDQIQALSTVITDNLLEKKQLKPKIFETLQDRRKSLQSSLKYTLAEQTSYNVTAQAAIAGAIVCMKCLPEKLNPIIKPIMESIKREECEIYQQLSAESLVKLLDQTAVRQPSPNTKIIANLCALLKSDFDFTPKIIFPLKNFVEYDKNDIANPFVGILSLTQQNKSCEYNSITTPSTSTGTRGRPPINLDISIDDILSSEDPGKKLSRIQRMGSTAAIIEICKYFGENLVNKIPSLWHIMFETINTYLNKIPVMDVLDTKLIMQEDINELMTALQLCEIAVPHLHKTLHEEIFKLLPKYETLLTHPLKAIRNMVSRCIATLATIDDCEIILFVVDRIVPLLETLENVIYRQGAAEVVHRIVNKLQIKMVSYVVLLVVPLLGRMSDPDESVRLISTHCFATLIQLMPLDIHNSKNSSNSKNIIPEIKSKELREKKIRDREFLEYLFAPKTIPDFKVPISISAELRGYQQAGINWLWFLNKYNLHGILCDDMGLGKTLQAICILAGDHYNRNVERKLLEMPSIVICPPTLTGHWVYEVKKFLPSEFLRPLHYAGLPHDREKLRSRVGKFNLIVASYDTVRKDIDFFSSIHWNYCVLDEGHIIKNGKTKSSKAIKQLKALHRLILSGTPIQNNVLELWSLFDFLMPGFLGTEKEFISRYSKPILASRDAKSSLKEQEAGVLAMEALHRQILPFLLRRVKEDVLTDLPPKITQDLLCELSPLQERLYEDFSKTHLNSEIKDCIEQFSGNTGENLQKKTHIFQALRYLQNVCNHPKLILNTSHPEYEKITHELLSSHQSLDDIEHSAKLPALKQLLLDCGIGVEENNDTVNQHRALIFCQLKSMLDIVENDLLKKHLPSVSYLRLDGSVPAHCRHDIVTKFNGDPSIDVLLLTTQVGGLGLNLTGADTVIFVEHDWNPMKDLQAMDRAHRIGQKKVVNVYRLITRKSLEEKIMGLQKFKILTANTVVSSENANMETMGTEQLLDLFNLSEENNHKSHTSSDSGGNVSMKQVIENLPELWDEKQYCEEYDLTQFVKSLKK